MKFNSCVNSRGIVTVEYYLKLDYYPERRGHKPASVLIQKRTNLTDNNHKSKSTKHILLKIRSNSLSKCRGLAELSGYKGAKLF